MYWNADAYWANVPTEVWEFEIGGFPVLRKWLEDRKREKLGRPLRLAEIESFTAIARRIAVLLLMGDDLDAYHDIVAALELVSVSGPSS